MVLASSKKNKGKSLGRLSGFGASCDATHITAPEISGNGLATAIRQAVTGDIGAILGHGTGTIFNDQAEINAINKVFGDNSTPMVSLKANLGHTLGAAGIVQAVIALKMLNERQIPPQVGLSTPMAGAEKLVSKDIQKFKNGRILSLTLGFGGLNSAVLLEDC
jgi:3-oxoacyl-(acyl-carrier-protein) synthase